MGPGLPVAFLTAGRGILPSRDPDGHRAWSGPHQESGGRFFV